MKVSLGGAVSVTATERWLSEIRLGRAFAMGNSMGGVAAQNSHTQLFNPVASGVTILVRHVWARAGAAGQVRLRTHNTALTTLVSAGVNLLSGGAAGLGQVRQVNNAGMLGNDVELGWFLPAEPTLRPVDDWWFELGAGEGVLVVVETVNVALATAWRWIEV